jgi:bacterioferritin-associated ferredoxin
MFVCVCNALTERQVAQAMAASGAPTAGAVYRALGCAPLCGRCVPAVKAMLQVQRPQPVPALVPLAAE